MFDKIIASFMGIGCLLWIAVIVIVIVGEVSHIVHCIHTEQWLLLFAGAIAVPVAVIHGWGLIFGWFG